MIAIYNRLDAFMASDYAVQMPHSVYKDDLTNKSRDTVPGALVRDQRQKVLADDLH